MGKKITLVVMAVLGVMVVLVLIIAAKHLVFWTPSDEVAFSSGDIKLAGTLIKPSENGPFPAVVILHGSGPEPRTDLTLRAELNALVGAGFAVLVYDKRGVDASGGDFESASYRDFINDGIAAVEYLSARDDVDENNIGIYAISEGAWFAPEVASQTAGIAFIFNKVGCPLSVADTVQWELYNDFLADGIAEADVPALVDITRRRWDYYRAAAADPSVEHSGLREQLNAELARLRSTISGAEQVISAELRPYDAHFYSEFSADTYYDPLPHLNKLNLPLYYAFGELDINMPTQQCIGILESMIQHQGKNISYTVYPGVGHSLAHWNGFFNLGLPDGYLSNLGQWTATQVR